MLLDIGGTAGMIQGFALPANQAFNPFGTANGVPTANALGFAANTAWRIRRVMADIGNRDNVQDVETIRVAAGLDGEFKVLDRDWNGMLALGGNIYFTSKIAATDGLSFQQIAAIMSGVSQPEYAAMMLAGGRSIESNRSKKDKAGG